MSDDDTPEHVARGELARARSDELRQRQIELARGETATAESAARAQATCRRGDGARAKLITAPQSGMTMPNKRTYVRRLRRSLGLVRPQSPEVFTGAVPQCHPHLPVHHDHAELDRVHE